MMNASKIFRTIVTVGIVSATCAFAQSATTLRGVVTDQMCGAAKHMMPGGAAKCTRECVKQGSSYALAVGDKVYTLKGHEKELYKLAGENVTVKGSLSGTDVQVSSVEAAK